MSLARDLHRECNRFDSDDDEDKVLKKRMKLASRRIFARILDEVEGETEEKMQAEMAEDDPLVEE